MIKAIYNLFWLSFSLIWSFWTNLFLLPCFLAWRTYCSIFEKSQKLQQLANLNIFRKMQNFYKNGIQYLKKIFHIQSRNSTAQAFLRYSRSQQNIHETLQRAAACPDDITQNEKVIMLIEKMRRLEETIFQQSMDRRKAESELFQLRIKLQEKKSEVIKERSACIQNLNKINFLKLELHEKNEEIQKYKKSMEQFLEEKKKYEHIFDQKIQKVCNEQNENSSYLLIKEVAHNSESQNEQIEVKGVDQQEIITEPYLSSININQAEQQVQSS